MSGALILEQVRQRTETFYSRFCGVSLAEAGPGAHLVCSPERDEILRGFGRRFPIYILVKEGFSAACCAPRYQELLRPLESLSPEGTAQAAEAAYRQGRLKKMRLMVFAGGGTEDFSGAAVLRPEDYPAFLAFYRQAHPGANPEGWLEEYFLEKASQEWMTGYWDQGRLACVCDAPDMPYLQGLVQHTGIFTLPQARRRGFARRAAGLAARHLMELGLSPQWECAADNEASFRLALAVGYQPYGTAYILEE